MAACKFTPSASLVHPPSFCSSKVRNPLYCKRNKSLLRRGKVDFPMDNSFTTNLYPNSLGAWQTFKIAQSFPNLCHKCSRYGLFTPGMEDQPNVCDYLLQLEPIWHPENPLASWTCSTASLLQHRTTTYNHYEWKQTSKQQSPPRLCFKVVRQ